MVGMGVVEGWIWDGEVGLGCSSILDFDSTAEFFPPSLSSPPPPSSETEL